MQVLCALLTAYMVVLAARAILSFLPPQPGGMATINRVLMDLTEPVLAPMRRVMPAVGMLDLSFMVLFFFVAILRSQVCA